jgi:hypothetical protein
MLKERMREFCLDLCPAKARDINRCIDDMIPFVVYTEQEIFQELEEDPPVPLSKAARMFPLRKKIYSHQDVKRKNDKSFLDEQKQKFNIWEKYNIVLDKKKTNPLKNRKL